MSVSENEPYDSSTSTYGESEAPLHNVTSLEDSGVLTRQEQLKICCTPTYRMRRLRNRGAILLLVWNYLIISPFFVSQKRSISKGNYTLPFTLYMVAGGLTLSIAGWIADVYFGRYKVIQFSMWIMWIAYMLMTASTVVTELNWFEGYSNKFNGYINEIFMIVAVIGLGAFQPNIIQFGIDQLHDASSDEISAFIIWYMWTGYASGIVAHFVDYIPKKYKAIQNLVICIHLSVALCLLSLFKHTLIKEPVTKSPFKLVYNVIRYAKKHKYIGYRSAFTYCEDELPSRIDFSKSKYGGPFTTEQVEDVKTFLRLLVIVAMVSISFGVIFTSYSLLLRLLKLFSLQVCTDKSCYFKHSFIAIVEFSWAFLLPIFEFIIYPIFHRFLSCIKTKALLMTGVLLQIPVAVSLMLIEIMARHNSLDSGSNITIQCVRSDTFELSYRIDYRWLALPCIVYSLSVAFWSIGTIRFIAAQSPYSMRGLVMGSLYGLFFLSAAVGIAISLPFTRNLSLWGKGIISCGFWHSLIILIITGTTSVLYMLILNWYKSRKREDVLPNEHIFAERYYEK